MKRKTPGGQIMLRTCLILCLLAVVACRSGEQDDSVLATVNGTAISREQFTSQFQSLTAKSRKYFENDRVGLLEELITRELLFQEATRRGITGGSQEAGVTSQDRRIQLVQVLVDQELQTVTAAEEEVRAYYDAHRSQFTGGFESARTQISNLIIQQKRGEKYEEFVQQLRSRATITRNEKWIKKNTPGNPLDGVLGRGKPVLADFGRGVCIPCKKMKPILEEVKREYKGRAHVLIVETDKHRAVTRQHRVRLIPTQIFFDRDGNERYRHEGFMPKEEIVTKLDELLKG